MKTIFEENQELFNDFFERAEEKALNVIIIVKDENDNCETIFSGHNSDIDNEDMLIGHNEAFFKEYPSFKKSIAEDYIKEKLSEVGEMAIPALNNFAGIAKDFLTAFAPKNQNPEPEKCILEKLVLIQLPAKTILEDA